MADPSYARSSGSTRYTGLSVRSESSVALSPLLGLRKKLRERDGQIIICNLSRSVGDVSYATKLVSSGSYFSAPFEMAPDVPTAASEQRANAHRLPQRARRAARQALRLTRGLAGRLRLAQAGRRCPPTPVMARSGAGATF